MSFNRQHISFQRQVKIVLSIAGLILAVEILNIISGRYLSQFGLIPRDVSTWYGIFFAPFLHGSVWHFFSNIVPFAVFSFLLLQHGAKRFALVTAFCIVVSGLLVWLMGRTAIHIGASGLIYGYFGYLLLAGILSKEIKLLFISLLVGFVYGGLIWGILPSAPYISWEGHLFGFISGLGCAVFWARAE